MDEVASSFRKEPSARPRRISEEACCLERGLDLGIVMVERECTSQCKQWCPSLENTHTKHIWGDWEWMAGKRNSTDWWTQWWTQQLALWVWQGWRASWICSQAAVGCVERQLVDKRHPMP